MTNTDVDTARKTFTTDEQDQVITALAEPISDRPIEKVQPRVSAYPGGRKSHRWYQSSKVQYGIIFAIALAIISILSSLLGGGSKSPNAQANESSEIKQLKSDLVKVTKEKQNLAESNAQLTQSAQFHQIPVENPNSKQTTPKPGQRLPPTSNSSQRTRVKPQNTVRIPKNSLSRSTPSSQRLITPPPARSASIQPSSVKPVKSDGPSLSECIDIVRQDLEVDACNKHRIKKKSTPEQTPIKIGRTPKPLANKPINLKKIDRNQIPSTVAFAKKTKPVSKKDYQVNFAQGQIQTEEQFNEEFYGSGSTATAGAKYPAMKARLAEAIDWTSPKEAQGMTIPLKITSGPKQGQSAEAKITQMNGTQFTAHVTRINGQEVEPGTIELRRKGTRFLKADIKTQGGSNSFGQKIINTAAAIGGEVVSDKLANVRGGNHISKLVEQDNFNSSGSPTSQYLRFKSGEIELVPVSGG